MAEDDMEISSEHGHNDADEDIDIDFDFTAGQLDEDHIIEDVGAHDREEDDLQLQPAAIALYDEEMVDEDDHSYQMDDADLLHDEEASFAAIEPTPFEADVLEHREDYTIVSSPKVEAFRYGETLDLEPLNDEGHNILLSENHDVGQGNEQQALQEHRDASKTPAAEEPASALQSGSTNSTPRNHSALNAPTVDEPRSPPVSIHNSGATSPQDTTSHAESNLRDENIRLGLDSAAALEKNVDLNILSSFPDFVVSWDGKHYPLFSTSESDNPDTYFLSDKSILDKPLVNFFEAIREVIQGDLSEEDELVLCIDDLGLETSETSTSVQSVSLSQILDVRQQLLHNDGDGDQSDHRDESSDQFYISITVKKNFSMRLSNLIKGAAEGKRMVDFWEERTHSLGELIEETEIPYDQESVLESPSSEDVPGGEENSGFEGTESKSHVGNSSNNQESTHSSPQEHATDNVTSVSEGEVGGANFSHGQPEDGTPVAGSALYDDVDEDGDFIDYSEDEQGLVEEENNVSNSATDNENTEDVHGTREEVAGDDFDSVDYAGEVLNQDLEAESGLHQYQRGDGVATDLAVGEHQDYSIIGGEPSGDEVFEKDHASFELKNDGEEYIELLGEGQSPGLELGIENESHLEVSAQSSADILATKTNNFEGQSNEGEVVDPTTNSAAGSVAFPDTAESSVTLSADEIHYDDGQDEDVLDFSIPPEPDFSNENATGEPLEQKDEIDYEEDDDAEEERLELISHSHSTPETKTSSPNGKRSIAEVDSEEVLDTRSNGAKRSRS